MTYTRHVTINIEANGRMEQREGELPAIIKRPPVSVTVSDSTDCRLAVELLRKLADEMERESGDTT